MDDYQGFAALFGAIGTKGIVKNLSVKESCIILDETKVVVQRGYYSGFIYGDSVGFTDNVSVSSSYIAIKDNTRTVILEHNHVEPLMHMYYGGNFVASYVQAVNDRYMSSKQLIQEMYLSIYYEGTGVLTSALPDYDYFSITNKIDGALSRHYFVIQEIYVGEGITELAERCFDYLVPHHLYLPSTLKKLNYLSIMGCTGNVIILPRSIERIEEYAIYASGATIVLPNTVEYLDPNWIASATNIYFEGTKDEYLALGQTMYSWFTYVFGYNQETNIKGTVTITLEYNGKVNPYSGNYLQLTYDGQSKTLPITNTTKFTFQGCTSNKISYLEIVSSLGAVIKDFGSFVLNEANSYAYSEKISIYESVPTITITLYDENGKAVTGGYRIDLYKGDGVIDSNEATGKSYVFNGIESGSYEAHVVLHDDLAKKYKAVEDITIDLGTEDVNKSIQLSLIKEKTITFTVIDEEETPIENALITQDEIYTSSIHKFYTGLTDENGKVSFDVHTVPIEYTLKKEGYIPEGDSISDSTTKVSVTPSVISGIPVRLNVLAKSGNGLIKSITDIDSKNLRIYKNTTIAYILDYYLYDSKVYLPLSMASYSDSITFTVYGIKNMEVASEEIILKDFAMVNITVVEESYFTFTNVTAYVIIFDNSNNLVVSFSTKRQHTSSHLPHGEYKILLIDDDLGCHINSLNELSKYPFVLNQDYYLINKTLSDSVCEIKDYTVASNIGLVSNNIINLGTSGTLLRSNGLCVGEFQTVRILLDSNKAYNGKLEVIIPKECTFQNGSLRVDNKERDYTIVDGKVLVDITDKDTSIKYSICCNQEANNIEVKARILANDTFYPILSAYFQTYLLKYTLDTTKDIDTTLNVAGLTISLATIELYDNGNLIRKTLSDTIGAFSIKEIVDKRREVHEIYLKVIKDRKVITTSDKKDINLSYFSVASLVICHNGNRYKVGFNTVSSFSFNPKKTIIGFEAILDDNFVDSLELIIKLTNGDTRTLVMEYNSEKGFWYQEGEFTSTALPSHISLRINDGMTFTYQALTYGSLKAVTEKSSTSTQTLDKDTFNVTSIGLTLVSSNEVTFRVNGTMLSKAVSFIAVCGGLRLEPIKEYYVSLEEVYVTFDFSSVKSGDYYLHVTYNGYFIDKNFTIDNNLPFGYTGYDFNVPGYGAINTVQTGNIVLENRGYTDCMTKVVILSGEDIVLEKSGKKDLIDIISCDGLAGTLLAKEDGTYYFPYRVTGTNPKITCCFLDRVNDRLFDSPDISQVGKNSVRENVYSIIGNDSTSNQKAISEMANYLSTIGYNKVTIEDCEKAIVTKAKGFYGTEALFVDSIITEPHFDLYRIYNCTTERHLEEGIFGRGIFTNFEITLKKENDVYIMYLPEERIYFNEYLGKYYSYDGRYTLTISSTSGTIAKDDTKYIFDDG
jgi:hypothetical protein